MRTVPFLLGALLLLPTLLAPPGVADAPVFQVVDDRPQFGFAPLVARGEGLIALVHDLEVQPRVTPGIYEMTPSGGILLTEFQPYSAEVAADQEGGLYFRAVHDGVNVHGRLREGEWTPIASQFTGHAFGPDGKLYGCKHGNPSHLARIGHGRAMEVFPLACQDALAFSPSGDLYGVTRDGVVRIDLDTMTQSLVLRLRYARDLAFDVNGAAYTFDFRGSQGAMLVRFDPLDPVPAHLAPVPYTYTMDLAFSGSRLWASVYGMSSHDAAIGYFDLDVDGFEGFQPAPLELPPLPDLVVESIEFVRTPLETPLGVVDNDVNERRSVRVTVANVGGGEAGAFVLTLYHRALLMLPTHHQHLHEATVPGLAAGERTVIEFSYDATFQVGRQRFAALVDTAHGGVVLEADEGNNWAQADDIVRTPLPVSMG